MGLREVAYSYEVEATPKRLDVQRILYSYGILMLMGLYLSVYFIIVFQLI